MKKELISSENVRINKTKELNNARYIGYTLNSLQALDLLSSKIKTLDKEGRSISVQDLERSHSISAEEFSIVYKVDISNSYKILKKAALDLARNFIEKKEKGGIWRFPIAESTHYKPETGLSIVFNKAAMEHYGKVERNFATYYIKETEPFRSKYSVRLYHLLKEYHDTGFMVKSVEELRHALDCIDCLMDYKNFKDRAIKHAVDEMNSIYEICLTMRPKKEGKKVDSVLFEFNKTKTCWKRKEQ